MKLFNFFFSLIAVTLFSCNDDSEKRIAANQKEAQRVEAVFAKVSEAWHFNTQPINATSQELSVSWTAWRVFLNELSQKPKSTIGAFRKKAQTLSLRAEDMRFNIPIKYDKPEIRSRIAVLTTKIHALDLFLNLNQIDAEQVTKLISEINLHLRSLQTQLDEIVRKSRIPKEEGESDMIRMLDTSRAIPNNPPKVVPQKEGENPLMIRKRPRKKMADL